MPERVTVEVIATDNLVSRNGARYPLSELPAVAKYLVDKPASIDHPSPFRGSVTDEWGTIVSSVVRQAEPPADLDEHNRAIVAAEGYFQVIVAVSCPVDTEHLTAFAENIRLRVSISALYQFMRCPGCKCGADIFSRECVNDFWEIPYIERHGVCDGLEISLVAVPAVRCARVISVNGEAV